MDSERHHYIPKYFIKGFADESNKLWVYDKIKDEIGQRSVKQIFYEWNLNTIQEKDFLEETYSKVDNFLSVRIKQIARDWPIEQIENDTELLSVFIFFLINLFWRNPHKGIDHLNSLKFLGLEDAGLINRTLTPAENLKLIKLFAPFDLISKRLKTGKWSFKIFDVKEFVLTDNPILFQHPPITIDDFVDTFTIPISKTRVFIGLNSREYNLGVQEFKAINLLSTFQANRYVAASTRSFIEQIITGYKHWMKIDFHIPELKGKFFKTINKTPDNQVDGSASND